MNVRNFRTKSFLNWEKFTRINRLRQTKFPMSMKLIIHLISCSKRWLTMFRFDIRCASSVFGWIHKNKLRKQYWFGCTHIAHNWAHSHSSNILKHTQTNTNYLGQSIRVRHMLQLTSVSNRNRKKGTEHPKIRAYALPIES